VSLKIDQQELLEQLQNHPDSARRYHAFMMLRQAIAGRDEWAGIVELGLSDTDSAVIARAALEAGRLAAGSFPDTIRAKVLGLLNHTDPDVRFEAARGLAGLNDPSPAVADVLFLLAGDLETHPQLIAACLDAFASWSERAATPERSKGIIDLAMKSMAAAQPELRESAAKTLGEMGPAAAVAIPQLLEALDDDEPFVREFAATSLGQIGTTTTEVLEALTLATEDEDEVVAEKAAAALKQLKPI
jgi:HEAT repeat protein